MRALIPSPPPLREAASHVGHPGCVFLPVTPAKSPDQVRGGVQGNQHAPATLDPGFRRDDEGEEEANPPAIDHRAEKRAGGFLLLQHRVHFRISS